MQYTQIHMSLDVDDFLMIYDPILIPIAQPSRFAGTYFIYIQDNDKRQFDFGLRGPVIRQTEQQMADLYIEQTKGEDHY